MSDWRKRVLGEGAKGCKPLPPPPIPLPQSQKGFYWAWEGGAHGPPFPGPHKGGGVGSLRGDCKRACGPPALPSKPLISIIIPVLNEARVLPGILAGLPAAQDVEVILVDGGSTDGTWQVAEGYPHLCRLKAPRGRGRQMNAGVRAARGDILVFLHADTAFGPPHLTALRQAAADPLFAAGAFEVTLTPPFPALKFIAWGANWRSRLFGLPYGDQVLTLRRDLFFALGGFAHRRPEDLDLVIRLKRLARLRLLTPPVASSGRRWLENGYFRTTLNHWLLLALHLAERTFTHRWPKRGDLMCGGGG
ncbi:MAG: TIGR04283 family arsenosugar biosynthesis glycosyltransferase [Desulfobaccales bacterium]|nr:TIGR04283 family arsenosugar biosynthesis glycosyltransferase [Desulfobaccales bacterium]